jgi:carboxyl-terminal processing protease
VKKETKKERELSFNLVEIIIIVIITVLVSCSVFAFLVFNNYIKTGSDRVTNNTISIDKDSDKYLKEFIKTYNNIVDNYVESVDKEELIDKAIEGMFYYLDDNYTNYLDESQTEDLMEKLDGVYNGIGVEIITESDNTVKVNKVFENSPASKGGLQKGDIILKLDDEDVSEKGASYFANKVKNGEKSSFKITIKRNEEIIELTLSTESVEIPSVESEIYDNIGYIKIETFSALTYEQFSDKLEELEKNNITGLVIDLRDNTGGYLNVTSKIADIFIEKNKVIYELKDNTGVIKKYRAETSSNKNYPISVIINGASASASEILALALKESYGATIVGTTSFGKGTIQETESLTSGSMVKYTTAYWLSPNGNSINNVGIEPDIVIENETEEDSQLLKAIEIVK